MKNKRLISLLRFIRGASLAHSRARINRQLRAYNQSNIAGNWIAQGHSRFDGGLTL
jgi:hypothetical protein